MYTLTSYATAKMRLHHEDRHTTFEVLFGAMIIINFSISKKTRSRNKYYSLTRFKDPPYGSNPSRRTNVMVIALQVVLVDYSVLFTQSNQ